MNKAELEKLLEEQANANNGNKQRSSWLHISTQQARTLLNSIFLLLALVGVSIYYAHSHTTGLIIVGAALAVKVIEFIIRFLM